MTDLFKRLIETKTEADVLEVQYAIGGEYPLPETIKEDNANTRPELVEVSKEDDVLDIPEFMKNRKGSKVKYKETKERTVEREDSIEIPWFMDKRKMEMAKSYDGEPEFIKRRRERRGF